MKRIIIILLITVITTVVGLYYRPSFLMIGKLDWFNVLTKGYFANSLSAFLSQGFLDESFYFVMRFTVAGLGGGFLLTMFFGGKKKSKKK